MASTLLNLIPNLITDRQKLVDELYKYGYFINDNNDIFSLDRRVKKPIAKTKRINDYMTAIYKKDIILRVHFDMSDSSSFIGYRIDGRAEDFDLTKFRAELNESIDSGQRCGECWGYKHNGTCRECEKRAELNDYIRNSDGSDKTDEYWLNLIAEAKDDYLDNPGLYLNEKECTDSFFIPRFVIRKFGIKLDPTKTDNRGKCRKNKPEDYHGLIKFAVEEVKDSYSFSNGSFTNVKTGKELKRHKSHGKNNRYSFRCNGYRYTFTMEGDIITNVNRTG